jgi:hypothetical protein
MSLGSAVARAQAANRRRAGTQITVGAKTVWAVSRAISNREHEYVPEGLGINAAEADLTLFNVTPGDLVPDPTPGTPVTWQGVAFLVYAVPPPEQVAGVAVGLSLHCYRQPATAPDPSDAAQVALWPAPPPQ